MVPLRAVIFDFGGVLCFHPDDTRWRRAAEASGLPVADFMSAFWANRIRYDAGLCEPAEYWHAVAHTAGTHIDDHRIPALIRCEIELWNQYDSRVLAWANQLRAAGYRTAILSNLPRPLGEELRATPGFLDHFDHVTFSYELGIVKPQPEIYLDATRGLGVDSEQALFLDDRPDNVEGAQAVGLHAQLYSTWDDFVAGGFPASYALPAPGLADDVARRQ
ncbi:MAG TPA: HAD family phosphatase [Bryobacteraceae bacterium]|nr:HAD family phosphatase [Bryobacteraceae bacterium]